MTKESSDDEKEYLFSKEFRDFLTPFGNMDVTECLKSEEFMRALCMYTGMSYEELDGTLDKHE